MRQTFYQNRHAGCIVEDKARVRGGHGGYGLLDTTEDGTTKVEVKGRLVKVGSIRMAYQTCTYRSRSRNSTTDSG